MAQYVYSKGEKCYCKTLFGYRKVTVVDRKMIIIDLGPFQTTSDYTYLIEFRNGKIKEVPSKKLF